MRARLPLVVLIGLLPACGMERSPSLTAPPMGAQTVRLCAAVDGRLRDFTGWIDPATGDTMVSGRRFRDVFPASYAGGQPWFERKEALPQDFFRYRPYGLPRTLAPADLEKPGLELAYTLDGIEMFATLPRHEGYEEARKNGREVWHNEILYVLVHAGCLFQPYEDPSTIGAVRDDEGR